MIKYKIEDHIGLIDMITEDESKKLMEFGILFDNYHIMKQVIINDGFSSDSMWFFQILRRKTGKVVNLTEDDGNFIISLI